MNGLIFSNKGTCYRGIWYHGLVQGRVRAKLESLSMNYVLYAVIPPIPNISSWTLSSILHRQRPYLDLKWKRNLLCTQTHLVLSDRCALQDNFVVFLSSPKRIISSLAHHDNRRISFGWYSITFWAKFLRPWVTNMLAPR